MNPRLKINTETDYVGLKKSKHEIKYYLVLHQKRASTNDFVKHRLDSERYKNRMMTISIHATKEGRLYLIMVLGLNIW